ncbi:MAG: inorganic diphosphatase [Patescibacteria group bacterium]
MNLWHDVAIGEGAPESFNAIIEIPRGSQNKYEVDKATGLIKLDRAFSASMAYPTDYGFVPQTYWYDDDPLDVMVLSTFSLQPGMLVVVRPVGVLRMIDGGDRDEKIIAVPVKDPRFSDTKDLSDLPEHFQKEVRHFYERYKELEGKVVEVKEFEGRGAAVAVVKEAMELYQKKFGASMSG